MGMDSLTVWMNMTVPYTGGANVQGAIIGTISLMLCVIVLINSFRK